jgi:hypothetical protein
VDSKPGIGWAAVVMALDFAVMVAAWLVWRSWGWPYATGVFLAGTVAVFRVGFFRRPR